jgi:F420-0:gamma-glutamyl ligase
MKKILFAASVALCFATSTFAQEKVGSTSAFGSTLGAVTIPAVAAGVSALAVLAGINSNSKGTITPVVVIPGPELTCNGSDPLVDGVCTGTTTTVTVTGTSTGTGTGTSTGTVTVPVTFTYVPTL